MRFKTAGLVVAALLVLGPGPAAAGQVAPAPRPVKLKVAAEQANLREKPDIGSAIVQMIPEGTVLQADGRDGEWYFVRYALEDGGVIGGFIHESLVEVLGEAAPAPAPKAPEPAPPPGRERRPRAGGIGRIERPEFRSGSVPLEISFSAGAGPVAPRHLNDGTKGYAGYAGAVLGLPAPDAPDTVGLAVAAGFELVYRASPRLAVGLGADWVRGAAGDELLFESETASETLVTKPAARAVPVKLIVRYYPGAGFFVRGGLGVYAVKAAYLYRHVREDGWEQWKGQATGGGLGAEAALGGEWKVASRTLLFAEAGFRYARFGGLTGTGVYADSTGDSRTEPGTLYFFRRTAPDGETYPLLFVLAEPPEGEDIVDARRAVLDLSGTAVRVGIRYRF